MSILTSIARRQKLANLFLLLILIFAMVAIQQAIDLKGLGSGNLVYWISGIVLALMWWILSQKHTGKSESFHYLIQNGEISVREDHLDEDKKLLRAYAKVTSKLKLDPEKYNLIVKDDKNHNAFTSGLSKGKTVGVFSHSVINSTDYELESFLAHEFGHLINRDIAFTAIRTSMGCGIGLPISIFGFGVVWSYWGFLNALLYFVLTIAIALVANKISPKLVPFIPNLVTLIAVNLLWGPEAMAIYYVFSTFVIPMATSYASKVTEEFADSFATYYGYGPGLISIFSNKLDANKGLELFSSHPFHQTRINYISKVMKGNEGTVSESAERWIWFVIKVIFVSALAYYLHFYKEIGLQSTYLFLASGGFFIVADNLLNGNSGSWHTAISSISKNSQTKMKFSTCVSTLLMLACYFALYIGGIYASYHFMNLGTSSILVPLSTICFYAWIAKPFTSLVGYWNDLLSTVSDFTTYFAVVISLLMMVSFFITITI